MLDLYRNIIEKSHEKLVLLRRSQLTALDSVILSQFNKAKEGDWMKERQQNRTNLGVLLFFTAAVLCILVVFIIIVSTLYGLISVSFIFSYRYFQSLH